MLQLEIEYRCGNLYAERVYNAPSSILLNHTSLENDKECFLDRTRRRYFKDSSQHYSTA